MTQVETNTCPYCQQPIVGTFFRFQGGNICPHCAEQIRAVDQLNHPTGGDLVKAGIAGLLAAIAAAVGWALLVKATNYELGIVAVVVGWIVVFAAMKANGGKRGVAMQVIVIACSLFAIYLGKNLTLGWAIWDKIVAASELSPGELRLLRIELLVIGAIRAFEPFDLVWYAIVIFGGWQRAKAIPINIEGPFGDRPQPPPDLQFNQAVYNQPPKPPQ